MRILFWGSVRYNSGPDNVNKCIVQNLTETFCWTNSKRTLFPSVNDVKHLIKSDVVVISGLSRDVYIMAILTKLFGKTLVYILHGYFAYESKVNENKRVGLGVMMEQLIIKMADLILPVSRKYMQQMQKWCPQYAHKMNYLYNGIDKKTLKTIQPEEKVPGTLAATGGIRILKNNRIVAQIAEEMNGNIEFTIYGAMGNSTPPANWKHTICTGVIRHEAYLQKLCKTELFIVNSIAESFSVSVIEALFCGCSILVSEVAGVTDLLALEESDVIHDPMDKHEIKEKILYLQQHPNNERIMSKLNVDDWTYDKMVQRLEKLCFELMQR